LTSWFCRLLAAPLLLVIAMNTAAAGMVDGTSAFLKGDYAAALQAFLVEARRGDIQAQVIVGDMYHRGQGIQRDEEQAVYWYRRAADAGSVEACSKLASMYLRGEGVAKDGQQAADWYRKAAERGGYLADYMLGWLYFKGEAVPKNPREAYFWLLVYTRGKADATVAEWLRSLELELSPQEQSEARVASEAWRPKVAASRGEPPMAIAPANPKQAPLPVPAPAPRKLMRSTGSGFFVSADRLVTNHHVAGDCARIRVAGQQEARLVSSDARNDLALVAVPPTSRGAAQLRAGRVNLGEPATVIGFPLSGLLSGINVTTGIVSSLSGIGGDSRLLQVTAPVQPGNSGGPLLDATGRVMGVVVSKLDTLAVAEATGDIPQNVNFAIAVSSLTAFLEAQGVAFRSSSGGAALSTQEIARRGQSFTVLVECWK